MQRFSFSERTAITLESGKIIVWEPGESPNDPNARIFSSSAGDLLLCPDNGWWWMRNSKEAPHCYYAQLWMGDYPYGSWCWAIRVCKETGQVSISEFETDINPRGLSTSDRWVEFCKAYTPEISLSGV